MLLVFRLAFGLLGFAAIGTQLQIQINSGFSLLNFFSFFTNLSNLFAAAIVLYGAIRLITGQKTSKLYLQARLISVVNMFVVGIVFAILLRDVDLGALLPWVNFTLHTIMPCVVVLDWILEPPDLKLGNKEVLLCQVFPAFYLAYTMVRGANTGWYPYPFLNPLSAGSYLAVAGYAAGIAVTFVIAGWCLAALGNKLAARKSQNPSHRI